MTDTVATLTLARVNRERFVTALRHAQSVSPTVAMATTPAADVVSDATFYLTADGFSGYAVTGTGELVYVFSLTRGRGDSLVSSAVSQGATHLDCFDGYLPTLYSRHGFVETHREPNWVDGGPDVVYMSRTAVSTAVA